jgi:hypothetical protein
MGANKKNPSGSGKQQRGYQKSGTKNHTILGILRDTPLHRFKAEEEGDHCLPSTISLLSRQHGLEFPRQWVKVPNRFGGETAVMEYSTSESDKEIIDEILGGLQ